MSFKSQIKNLSKIVMGVIVFLCASLILNLNAYAVDISEVSGNSSWKSGRTYLDLKYVGGKSNCLGVDNVNTNGSSYAGNSSYGNSLKLSCYKKKYVGSVLVNEPVYLEIHAPYVTKAYGGKCDSSKQNSYGALSFEVNFSEFAEDLMDGPTFCKPYYFNSSSEKWAVVGGGWNEAPTREFSIQKRTLIISHSGIDDDAKISNTDSRYSNGTFLNKKVLYTYLLSLLSDNQDDRNDIISDVGKIILPNLTATATYAEYKFLGYVVGDVITDDGKAIGNDNGKCSNSKNIIAPGSEVKIDVAYPHYVACWSKTKVVSPTASFETNLYANGGKFSDGKEVVTKTCTSSSCNVSDSMGSGITRDGYVPLGVATSANGCSTDIKTFAGSTFTTSTPNWYVCWDKVENSEHYYINIDPNKGIYDGESKTFTLECANSSCTKLNDSLKENLFTRTNYTFNGLSTSSSCTTVTSIANTKFVVGATYYACWAPKSTTTYPKITFDGNGGTLNGSSTNVMNCNNSPCSIASSNTPKFSRSGYTFLGWTKTQGCPEGSVYGQPITGVDKDTTYYACWKKNTTTPSTTSTTKPTTGTTGTTKPTTGTTVKKISVAFYKSVGTNFNCESGYDGTSWPGICAKQVDEFSTITLPSTSAYDANTGGKFLGWTAYLDDGSPRCTSSTIKASGTSWKLGNVTLEFYACYREDVNATRFAQEGASADGKTIPCGSALNITYCIKSTDGNDYCYYDQVGTASSIGKVYRNKISNSSSNTSCNTTASNVETINGYMYTTTAAVRDYNFTCGTKVYVTTCSNDVCNVSNYVTSDGNISAVTATVNKSYLKSSKDAALKDSSCKTSSLTQTSCSNVPTKNVKGTLTINMCYNASFSDEDVKNMINDNNLVMCGNGYIYDKTLTRASGEAECNDKICLRNYTVSCISEVKTGKGITVDTVPAFVDSDGYGTVNVKVYLSSGNTIVGYYLSEYLETPTSRSDWKSISSTSFDIRSTPGTQYIWVIDSSGNISNVSTIAVIDNVTSSTTLKTLQLSDGTNNIVPNRVSYVANSGNGYALLSSDKEQKVLLAQGFDSYTHEYKIDVESPTLAVYATLTSSDASYVEGYGPRTVNLVYGTNTILIKIRNNEGKIRTYTIIANRVDDRSADNTLNDISISVGDIEFNSNKTEYKITIPKNTTQLNVSAVINSNLASYVKGYEPSTVYIYGNTTVKIIKVMSETGSIRTYVLTFVKEGTDLISDESLQLFGLSIPKVNIPFESSIANYSFSVDYSSDVIDIYAPLKDNNSQVSFRVKNGNNGTFKNVSNLGVTLDVGENYVEIRVINSDLEEATYYLTIIRKENGLDVSNDTTLKDLQVLGYNIKFNPKDKEYSVKIKSEKSLVITAVPTSNRSEVFIRGNEELTGFSTVRIKVVAENGDYETYSIDIKKDPFNKAVEIAALVVGCVIILGSSYIIFMKNKNNKKKDYYRE